MPDYLSAIKLLHEGKVDEAKALFRGRCKLNSWKTKLSKLRREYVNHPDTKWKPEWDSTKLITMFADEVNSNIKSTETECSPYVEQLIEFNRMLMCSPKNKIINTTMAIRRGSKKFDSKFGLAAEYIRSHMPASEPVEHYYKLTLTSEEVLQCNKVIEEVKASKKRKLEEGGYGLTETLNEAPILIAFDQKLMSDMYAEYAYLNYPHDADEDEKLKWLFVHVSIMWGRRFKDILYASIEQSKEGGAWCRISGFCKEGGDPYDFPILVPFHYFKPKFYELQDEIKRRWKLPEEEEKCRLFFAEAVAQYYKGKTDWYLNSTPMHIHRLRKIYTALILWIFNTKNIGIVKFIEKALHHTGSGAVEFYCPGMYY